VGLCTSNLISTSDALKLREGHKYVDLDLYLIGRPHEFEYPLGKFVFDLVLFDKKILVEFDGSYHKYGAQPGVDLEKERIAISHGFTLVRRVTIRGEKISPKMLFGL